MKIQKPEDLSHYIEILTLGFRVMLLLLFGRATPFGGNMQLFLLLVLLITSVNAAANYEVLKEPGYERSCCNGYAHHNNVDHLVTQVMS